jgi:hypothetical protein
MQSVIEMSPQIKKKTKLQAAKLSPSISNRIPNSIAFRIKNHEGEEAQQTRIIIQPSDTNDTKNGFDEDQSLISTRRIMNEQGEAINFSLRDKNELNRNIPFSKLNNMDFSGIP